MKQAIDSAVAARAQLLHHDLEDLERADFGHGRVWLLGDAVHAMLPNLGQGAAMAIARSLKELVRPGIELAQSANVATEATL